MVLLLWMSGQVESRDWRIAVPAAVLFLVGGGLLGIFCFFLLAGVASVLNALLAGGWF